MYLPWECIPILLSDTQLPEHIIGIFTFHQAFAGLTVFECFQSLVVRDFHRERQTFSHFNLMEEDVDGFPCGESKFFQNALDFLFKVRFCPGVDECCFRYFTSPHFP